MFRFLMFIGRRNRRRFAVAALLGAVAAAASVILLALSGWFIVASAIAGAGGGVAFNYLFPSAGVRGAALTRVLAKYGEQLAGHDAILTLSANLRSRLFERIARSAPGGAAPGAEELSLLSDHVDAVEGAFLRIVLPAIATIAAAIVAIAVAARVDALSALALACVIAAAGFIGPRIASRAGRKREVEAAHLHDELRRQISDYVDGAPELIAYDAAPRAGEEILAASFEALEARRRIEAPHQLYGAAALALAFVFAAFVLWRGTATDAPVAITAGAALAALAALQATGVMAQAFDAAARASEAGARVKARLSAPDALQQPKEALAQKVVSILPLRLDSAVASPAPGVALAPVSFEIAAGEIVQLAGRSGAGKTTLLETILRLRDPASGDLSYAGVDWRELRAAAIRRHIGYAPQTPSFLAGDIEENLRLANPAADAAALDAALRTACMDDVIGAAPQGLATRLQNGAGLSGGELRRLGLARALLSAPELLILDEPFAGLDEAVASALSNNLMQWKTRMGAAIIFTSHQPQRAMKADKVVEI